jgi:hypothetical protein
MPKFWIERHDGRGIQYHKALPSYQFGYTKDYSAIHVGVIYPDSDKMYHVKWSGHTEVFPIFKDAREFAEIITSLEY